MKNIIIKLILLHWHRERAFLKSFLCQRPTIPNRFTYEYHSVHFWWVEFYVCVCDQTDTGNRQIVGNSTLNAFRRHISSRKVTDLLFFTLQCSKNSSIKPLNDPYITLLFAYMKIHIFNTLVLRDLSLV